MNAVPSEKPKPEKFDPLRYRADFPLLARRVHDKPLIYFDNANTAQKPQAVIDAVDRYYSQYNANVSRAESAPPQAIAEDYNIGAAAFTIGVHQPASEPRRDAEHVEERRGDVGAVDQLRLARAGEVRGRGRHPCRKH